MDREKKLETSTMRFETIAPLLSEGLSAGEKRRLRLEIMEKHGISERTLRRHLEKYRKGGLKGLERPDRPDAGTFKAIPAEILKLAMECKEEVPERSTKNVIKILEKEGYVKPGTVLRSTLSHNLHKLGHSTRQLRSESGTKAARRFVRVGRNTLWQSDIKFGPMVQDGKGGGQRTYLATFMDDATRVVCHSEFYLNHRVPILEDCFRKAMVKFGKPDAIYVDNGAEYTSRWLRIGCARLGIRHLNARPYSPESKGKIEKYNGFVDSFLREAALVKLENLAHLNRLYRAWLDESYQNEAHSSLGGKTPMECYQNDQKRLRWVTSTDV